MEEDKKTRELNPKYIPALRKNNIAFTLIELVIASLIFAIVMLTIYSAFHTGIFSLQHIENTIDAYQTAKQILDSINLDLRNSFAYSKQESKFTGDEYKISFFTLVDVHHGDKVNREYAFVFYALQENSLTQLYKNNKESLKESSDITPTEIAANIEEIIFSYGSMADKNKPIEWKDSWSDPKNLPLAVRVKLTIKGTTKYDFERTIFLPSAVL